MTHAQSVELLWTSDRPVAETVDKQNSNKGLTSPDGFRFCNLTKQAAADRSFRLRGNRDCV